MSHSDFENEQLEEAKNFLKQYGKWIILITIVGLSAIYGWRYWQSAQQQQLRESSDAYEQLVSQLSTDNAKAPENLNQFSQNTKNIYGVLGALELAKYYVGKADYASAQKQLEFAASNNKDGTLSAVINLRLARVLFQQKQYDNALHMLDKITDPTWQVTAKILRADIFSAREDYSTALDLYALAEGTSPTAEQAQEIAMKMNNVRYLKSVHQLDVAKKTKEAEEASANKTTAANTEQASSGGAQ